MTEIIGPPVLVGVTMHIISISSVSEVQMVSLYNLFFSFSFSSLCAFHLDEQASGLVSRSKIPTSPRRKGGDGIPMVGMTIASPLFSSRPTGRWTDSLVRGGHTYARESPTFLLVPADE